MSEQLVEVWLGAFNEYHAKNRAQPGDAWVSARITARTKSGKVWAEQLVGPHAAWIKPEHWRECSDG